MKTTLLIDTATNAVIDIHVTTTRKHDTQIAAQVVKRNAQSIAVLTGDKGYDDQKLRRLARNYDIRPLIKHRELPYSTKRGMHGWTTTSTIAET